MYLNAYSFLFSVILTFLLSYANYQTHSNTTSVSLDISHSATARANLVLHTSIKPRCIPFVKRLTRPLLSSQALYQWQYPLMLYWLSSLTPFPFYSSKSISIASFNNGLYSNKNTEFRARRRAVHEVLFWVVFLHPRVLLFHHQTFHSAQSRKRPAGTTLDLLCWENIMSPK